MKGLDEAFNKLHSVQNGLNGFLELFGPDGENISTDKNNLDEYFKFCQLQDIAGLLENVQFKMKYLSKKLINQGFIGLDKNGNYTFPDGMKISNGSEIEVLVSTGEGQEWIHTYIFEKEMGNYYALIGGSYYPMKKMMARIRENS